MFYAIKIVDKGGAGMTPIFEDGKFFVGCNYWASHAGTNMWHDWREDVIENDFRLLSEANIKYLRVFPLWPDFQPIKMLYRWAGIENEIRMGEDVLPFTEAGRAGVSEEMADRFETFCDLAKKYGIKLVVGLVTGWMSGRLYVPEIFEGVNVLTDARAIKWEVKFVKYMVKRFKNHEAIVAWDLGNECDCLAQVDTKDQAYLWANTITMAIKTEDDKRPVISGMHGTFPEAKFCAKDLGEILDVLCTHPYPLFTPHCMTDNITEQKSAMHAVAETVMYRGCSGKIAFAEEVGTLGPLIASEENSGAYANTILHQLWAHNCLGFMWWCGFEQTNLTHAPYDWNAVERELGLFRADFSKKPVLEVMSNFACEVEKFPYTKLPERIVDAVCIINAEEDTWLSAYGTFILAKQAGLDIEFCYVNDEIPPARAYIVPSVAHGNIPNHVMQELIGRVQDGAVLYLSLGDGLLSPFNDLFGLKGLCRHIPTKPDTVQLGGSEFELMSTAKITFEENGATVIACDENANPVMAENKCGKGTVYFVAYPIEDMIAQRPGVVSGEGAIALYKFYESMPLLRNPEKAVTKDNPEITVTEHILDANTRIVIAINCVPRESCTKLSLDGYKLSKEIKNQGADINANENEISLVMKPNSAVVLEISK